MSRIAYKQWRSADPLPKTAAIYLLYADHFDKSTFGKELYIGHSAQIDVRVDQHDAGKIYWSNVLVIATQSDKLNIAHSQNIEHHFIQWARLANRYQVMNGNIGASTPLGKDDTIWLKEFLSDVRSVLEIAGIDVFEQNLDGIFHYVWKSGSSKFESKIRIEEIGAIKKVRILEGSVICSLDDAKVRLTTQVQITYDEIHRTHTFLEDAVVDVDTSLSAKVFNGMYLFHWLSPCGVKLSDALKAS